MNTCILKKKGNIIYHAHNHPTSTLSLKPTGFSVWRPVVIAAGSVVFAGPFDPGGSDGSAGLATAYRNYQVQVRKLDLGNNL